MTASCDEQIVLFVEQRQYPLRRLSRLRPDAQHPQLGLNFSQALSGSGAWLASSAQAPTRIPPLGYVRADMH